MAHLTFESLEKAVSETPGMRSGRIRKAWEFANRIHANQAYAGRGFTQHLLEGAEEVASLGLDEETIIAELLHNAIDTGKVPANEVERHFGGEVARIVLELTKIREILNKNPNLKPGYTESIILASAKDIRTVIIAIVNRLTTLRSISHFPAEDAKRIARTSLSVFVPIAHKLGLMGIAAEMQDRSFRVLEPEKFEAARRVSGNRPELEKKLAEAEAEVSEKLAEQKLNATITGRVKTLYSISKKLERKKDNEMLDLLGIRIICNSPEECYQILGTVHSLYQFHPEEFSDYIAKPKQNGYQSIHTLINWHGTPLEIQIRDWRMHSEAESGLSAHWHYKEFEKNKYFDKRLSWAKELAEWGKGRGKSELEKIAALTIGGNEIFVLTPKNEAIVLPKGSTPVDFAFAVHSDVGFNCHQAKVNGKMVPLETELQNGDQVEILTTKKKQAKSLWLGFVKSLKAIQKIKQALGIRSVEKKPVKEKRFVEIGKDNRVRMANCCNPLPGDKIIGYRTTKRKIAIHKADCKALGTLSSSKKVDVDWSDRLLKSYTAKIFITGRDRVGVMRDILEVFSANKVNVEGIDGRTSQNGSFEAAITAKIKSAEEVEKLLGKIRKVDSIAGAERR
ncbi:MAG: bifunctional (p)ppGpp synthetase/guanosine-3',5'-bis(diphosphate) 3'-pyrophosphohydrolase [Candidatus Diapherotrites archaeon]|nr:bifunctional (p)ppGpp synthetase/guanosine-3',5'-bis(diphosphate) 3'-pyrophosphohydrolase [Candidatus Diapherotrites archaeon]